jgi:tetratricopeptide (TPR) repeat protein
MYRTALILLALGLLVLIVVLVSWTAFPAWRQTPGGFWILVATTVPGVLSVVGGVLEILKKIREVEQNAKAAPAPPSRLHQLPPDLVDFTGRDKQVQELLGLLRQNRKKAPIAVVVGMGGVGKSALAVHVAHRLTGRYPGAQIVVELHGTSERPLPPTEAMGQVIHTFHPELSLPDEPVQVAALYRDTLIGRRVLILLDDAADAAQVRSLLPPPRCGAIITSRRAMVLPGAHSLNLSSLKLEEACHLLQAIAGQDRATAKEVKAIAELCGRLPLALRVAGDFLAVHQDWSAAQYARALADERKRPARLKHDDLDVGAVLGLSVAQLARERPDLTGQWEMLSIFPTSFDMEIAAATWEVGETEAHEHLSALMTRSLVSYDAEEKRYRLHDLMRDFARQHLEEQEGADELRQAAGLRAAHCYAKRADPMERRLRPEACRQEAEALASQTGRPLDEEQQGLTMQALSWFETERANLIQAVEWAYQAGEWKLVQRLAQNTVSFFIIRGHWADWEQSHKSALEAARAAQDRRNEAMICNLLANTYRLQGRWDEAADTLEEALRIHRELGDRYGESMARNLLANVYRLQGRWDEAIRMYEQSLYISQERNNRRGEAIALGGVGHVLRMQGRYAEALNEYEKSLRISRELGDLRGEGITLNNSGLVYCMQGRYAEAVDVLEESLRIADTLESPRSRSIGLRVLGEVHTAQDRFDEAIDRFSESLDIACRLGDLRVQSQSLNGLGKVHTQRQSWDEANQAFERALGIVRRLKDRHGEGLTLRNVGVLREKQGHKEAAVTVWQEALQKLHPDSPEHEDVAKRLQQEG